MSYYVTWDVGSCNDGSHSNGVEVFDAFAPMVAWVKDFLNTRTYDYPSVTVVRGEAVSYEEMGIEDDE